jgi:hypothetical protein
MPSVAECFSSSEMSIVAWPLTAQRLLRPKIEAARGEPVVHTGSSPGALVAVTLFA